MYKFIALSVIVLSASACYASESHSPGLEGVENARELGGSELMKNSHENLNRKLTALKA